jgi:uncharacterized protein YqkB/Flp pilus assembly protein TadG
MKKTIGFFVREALNDERGQILPWLAVVLVGLLGTAGLSIDVGRAYVVRSQLQNYANAAALAAAGEVYSTSSTNNASTIATSYSAGSGDENVNASLGTVTTTITTVCLNILMPSGTTCSSTGAVPNAVKVSEKATLPTYFMKLAGINSLSINSAATASMQGAAQPWNVAIVLDATTSMGDAPPSGSCSGYSTEFSCALSGVETLLQDVNPCSGVKSCGSSNAIFRVALFSFPNVSTASVSDDWSCSGTPTHEPYTLPDTNLSSYTTLTYSGTQATYEDTPVNTSDGDANGFVTDYWSGTSSNRLNSSSSLAEEVTGCMKNPGGESTYYGGVIYAAQAALVAEQKAYGGKNALIMLSDGQANATSAKFPTGAASPSADGYAGTALTSTGYYPSITDQCQQAITAAQAANTAGTTVYSVAFNTESDGCAVSGSGVTVTDTSLIATATTGNAALSLSTLTPCVVMKNIASPATSTQSYFYADTSSGSCTDSAHTVNQISTIFSAIAATFTSPRLLPNNAT